MTTSSLIRLSGRSLFVALLQIGFGAFRPVYLTRHGWMVAKMGFGVSLGAVFTMVVQLPGGQLVHAATSMRHSAGVPLSWS
jgi:hypothetical protein